MPALHSQDTRVLIPDPLHGRNRDESEDTLYKPPVPPKKFRTTSDVQVKRQKLSLNIGVLETDFDSPPPSKSSSISSNSNELNSQFISDTFSSENDHSSRKLSKSSERKISQDISDKVNKFEALATSSASRGQTGVTTASGPGKGLWFYCDGLRTPTTPTPGSAKVATMAPTVMDLAHGHGTNNDLMSKSVQDNDLMSISVQDNDLMSKSLSSIIINSAIASLSSQTDEDNPPPVVPASNDGLLPHPPPLPPKQTKEKSPPPRPLSKELRLEDILLLCAEYEKQIEAEKIEALNLSPPAQSHPVPPASLNSSTGPLSPGSPSSTLQPPRIKTNGSLPRDGKRLSSPCRSLPPNSPLVSAGVENDVSGIFTFDSRHMSGVVQGSPILSGSRLMTSGEGLMSPICSSPRTRIRTTLTSTTSSSSQQDNSLSADYQGGKEAIADTDKSKEQLYTEAKEILALVGAGGQTTTTPTDSPSNTGPRRPPRSKHDSLMSPDTMRPSSEAASRMLIGTVMLTNHLSPVSLDNVKKERNRVLEEVNMTTKELSELSIAIEEAERSVVMEQSLIGAELMGKQTELEELEALLKELRSKESKLGGHLKDRKEKNETEIQNAKQRLMSAEAALDELEQKQNDDMSTDEEMELLEQIKKSHELLEAERRIFEDLEFRQMEVEASMEVEMEDVTREINQTNQSLEAVEATVNEMEAERLEMSVNQDLSLMQEKKETVSRKLEEEKEKLSELEAKLRQMLVGGRKTSEDSGSSNMWPEANLDDRGWVENNISRVDSVGSSSSDLSPAPANMTTPQQRAGIPTPKQTTTGNNIMEDSLIFSDGESRPVSVGSALWSAADVTETSSWLGGVMRRDGRASSRAGQRPLTRYLPVTSQLDFDLRRHIETAGHQIELCRHIIVNSCSCRGYLHKMGAKLKTWNKRWFVFDRNKRTLIYFADKSESKVKGGIYFHSITEVYVDHQTSKSVAQRVTFVMKTHDRKYYLMAPSPEAMRIWVDVLFTGAEGYQEFQD